VMIYAGTRGHLDRQAVADIGAYERELYTFLETRHPAILATLADTKKIDDRLATVLDGALDEFTSVLQRRTLPLAAAA